MTALWGFGDEAEILKAAAEMVEAKLRETI
jgi:hypothetical protein